MARKVFRQDDDHLPPADPQGWRPFPPPAPLRRPQPISPPACLVLYLTPPTAAPSQIMGEFGGYEVHEAEGNFLFAFHEPLQAVQWMITAQENFNKCVLNVLKCALSHVLKCALSLHFLPF